MTLVARKICISEKIQKFSIYRSSTPFDRTSITGYLQYCTLELYIANCFGAAYFCGFLLFISACMYLEALCDDFIESFEQNHQLAVTEHLRYAETKQRLIDGINFQSEIDTYGFYANNSSSSQ